MVKDAEDALASAAAVAADDGSRIPLEVVMAQIDGAHSAKAWRERKGLTLQALPDAAGMSKPCVSQIEGGKCAGTVATLKNLAAALPVPVGGLMP